jgi:integrase
VLVAEYLASILPPIVSESDYQSVELRWGTHLLPYFPRLEDLTPARVEDYYKSRLRKVTRETVRKERGVLVRFVKWASTSGRDLIEPFDVPQLPAKAKGTPKLRGRNVTPLTRAEMLAIYERLPERSERRRRPLRARIVIAGELTLRRETIEQLGVPEHYRPGDGEIRITADIDKEGVARTLPLTPLARQALEAIAPDRGLIFGRFDYRSALRKVAAEVIGKERAEYLSLRDLRHAAITGLCEHTGSLGAVAAVSGHKDLQTVSRYFHANQRGAAAALEARSRADIRLVTRTKPRTVANSPEGDQGFTPEKPGQGRVAQWIERCPPEPSSESEFPAKNRES